ncbi:integrin alpha-9 isoform X2 [Prionailurus bengalensis]|uniref:integrin alpha-9 isoform X2 n=1 Tax=Prionailurus bengalensis TaxID=37029 RepID=UPI001CA80453|nr:integrin alpha-9 isoform X2 [Prionailurus bengalensis]
MGGPAARRGAGGLRALLLALLAAGTPAGAYNLDPQRPVRFQGPAGSFFGYAVLEHFHDNTRWVLVGAPKAESKYSTSVKSPGAVFKCRVHTNPDRRCTELDMARGKNRGMSCGKTCREDRDDEWMGVSLARQPKADGRVLACAHRWKNIYYETDHILPHGFCYIIPSNLQAKGRTLIPCYEEYKKKYGEEHGSCQAGIAGFFTEELVVMGAPGSFYWAGTVKVLNLTDNTYFKLNDEAIMNRRYTYLGYAVTAGSFSRPSTTDVVGGAPQDEGVGKVYIFRADQRSGTLIKIFQASGKKMGSYFGSSLCAVDLNADGLSDLLVGAPMFSEIRDEGQVTVYINRGNGALEEQLALSGDGTYNAHFGESIASLGDLDDDGFPDVAIGAPKEDDFSGAVYIYHGDASGIVPQYSMKLSGQKISPVLGMFGQSISGGIDMDGNGYPDVTVGAFMSDSVVLLRARPVITVDVSIFLPASINITAPQCHDGLQPVNCLNVTACFSFHGKHVPGEIGLNYVLTADVAKKAKGQLPRVYFVLLGESVGQVTEKLQLVHMEEMCHHYVAHVKRRVQDVISPIVFEAAYSLGEHVTGDEERELPPLTPVLRWKKGQKIAQKNQTVFERNCRSEDCATDLQLRGQLLLSSVDEKTPYLALGAVKNISLNISISNLGDDAYDANVSFNVSRELFFINMWQKEEMGISCELLESDFLKCSVGFPFMRSKSKYEFSVIFDTSHVSGEEEVLSFIVTAQSGNVERSESLHDNTLTLTVPLMHEVDTSITGIMSPTSFVYGESVDASNFIQLDDTECHFQPLNITLQVYNTGPSTLPGSSVSITFPNRLSSGGAEMFHVQEMMVAVPPPAEICLQDPPLCQGPPLLPPFCPPQPNIRPVGQEKGNCSFQKNPTPCIIPQEQENIFHTIFAFFTKSGRKVLDCEKPGISCLTMHCNLSALAKEESRTIDIYMLLNTEILKKDSSSVIQFMTRAKVKVDAALRVVEIANGNPEEMTVIFEALHNLEPRGYVVGWIIAISLLVGILIFLLLAVLLWKMGFFRRRYKEIIEAEKNRKENEDSWDWVQKNQ